MKKHIYPSLRLNEEELLDLNMEQREIHCLECGVKEVAEWSNQGPVAPPLSTEMLARVKRKHRTEWQGYVYKIAAGFAVLILVLQLGKHQGIVTSEDPREAAHFLVDSARNDTAFLLKETPGEDTVKAVSFIEENLEIEEGQLIKIQILATLFGSREAYDRLDKELEGTSVAKDFFQGERRGQLRNLVGIKTINIRRTPVLLS